ncbi:MAG: DNA mismatch repair protein MutS, partial [Rikenellaceae bacterium]
LFELKYFAYYVNRLHEQNSVEIEHLNEIFTILDPNKSGVVNFYIYDTYDRELARLRKEEKNEENYLAISHREEIVREQLSIELRPYAERLEKAIERIAEIDLLVAKSDFHTKNNLIRPTLSDIYESTTYEQIFNIYLLSMVKNYQKIDIELIPSPTLITGANMSGKTMLLKTVALAQYMIQFGFYAPATSCRVSLVDAVFLSVGDSQKEEEGLSSYAAEILKVSHIINEIEKKGKYLVLLDELARTTSPREGAAIVDGVTTLLKEKGVMSLITTHYSSLQAEARCLRVKGFIEERIEGELTKENISQFIDYSLT